MAQSQDDGADIVALVLSFFIAGLGQFYQGRTKEGALFLVAYLVSAGLTFFLIGFVLVPIVWIINMYDVYAEWLDL